MAPALPAVARLGFAAALLMVPYAACVGYAAALNLGILLPDQPCGPF